MDKAKAFKIVYEELTKCPLFVGTFDAKHGDTQLMYGICIVMENIALSASDETYEEFYTIWSNNLAKSIEKEN
jgi:hypothetical protein